VVGFAEGTNTIFVNISTTIFMLDLKSKKMRKVGEREGNQFNLILPYMSFYTPRYSSFAAFCTIYPFYNFYVIVLPKSSFTSSSSDKLEQ
jgi:hypothetical protein